MHLNNVQHVCPRYSRYQCLFRSFPFVGISDLATFVGNYGKWFKLDICSLCYDILMEGISSCVLLFNFLISWSFSILAIVFRFVGHHCGHIAMGFYIYLPLCQQVLDVSVSVVQQVVSKQAHGMPFCRRILNCPSHLSEIVYIFIGPYDCIYSSCSYIICCSRFWFYIHKRIRGAKNISSKQKCCS